MSRAEFPCEPAAFINAIADEGTKEEAIRWLQKIWDELCYVRRQASRQQPEPVALPSFIRREVERAIDAAVNPPPGSMTLGDGMARIGSDKLIYMLKLIDARSGATKDARSDDPETAAQERPTDGDHKL
jgi:hypothetical protein